jgi:uncharacterized membrane protein
VRLRAVTAAACLVGAGIAAYLTYVHYAGIAPVCTSGGCEQVQTSRYAELGGVPVALLGLVAYAVLLVLAAVRGAEAATAGVFVAVVGVGFSGYLLWAQLGPIGAICQWCLGNDLTITVVAALYVVRMLTETPKQKHA